jgi:hypothetical protein
MNHSFQIRSRQHHARVLSMLSRKARISGGGTLARLQPSRKSLQK